MIFTVILMITGLPLEDPFFMVAVEVVTVSTLPLIWHATSTQKGVYRDE